VASGTFAYLAFLSISVPVPFRRVRASVFTRADYDEHSAPVEVALCRESRGTSLRDVLAHRRVPTHLLSVLVGLSSHARSPPGPWVHADGGCDTGFRRSPSGCAHSPFEMGFRQFRCTQSERARRTPYPPTSSDRRRLPTMLLFRLAFASGYVGSSGTPPQFLLSLTGISQSASRRTPGVRRFLENVTKQAGRGRGALEAWPDLCIATVIKHTKKKRIVDITRNVARGTQEKANERLRRTHGGVAFTTAFLERVHGTVRERLASFTRTCRHAAARMETLDVGVSLIGCPGTFCFPHQELSKKASVGCPTTPAMAAVLTDHIWGMRELLR
jgi:hypothetical protein